MSMLLDDDEMAVASSKEASRGVIREHLEDHLANNPRTSFAGKRQLTTRSDGASLFTLNPPPTHHLCEKDG